MEAASRTLGFVLLSGGIDSTTALQYAINQLGVDNVWAYSVDYGQRHRKEIRHAQIIADKYGIKHYTTSIYGQPRSMLTDHQSEIPNTSYAGLPHGISPTYVPFRNGQLLSRIAACAQSYIKELDDSGEARTDGIIYFGAHAEDSQNWAYPDCTPEFTGSMANAIYIGTYQRIRLVVPWQHYLKHEIISYGVKYDVPYDLTWSCYAGDNLHCGTCPTCRARIEAFSVAGVQDPTVYNNV